MTCRQQIQLAAAEPSSWSDAEEFLRDQPFDSVAFGSSASHSSHDDHNAHDRKAAASAEMAQVLGMLHPTDDPQMLGRLGGYEVSGVIGSGGMGIVLKAFDGPLDRTVAIKVLAPRLASSGAARRRFAREAKAAATVLHPNVIVIHGVSNDGPLPFLVMPYLRGDSLQRRLDRQGPLPTEEIVRIAQQVASGLAAAHGQGLVHRDAAPEMSRSSPAADADRVARRMPRAGTSKRILANVAASVSKCGIDFGELHGHCWNLCHQQIDL